MKKTLFAAAGLVLALTACQKEDITSGNGIPATQSITVSIPQTGMMSRAAISEYGDGSKINRCVMQVYHDGVPYGDRQVEPLTVGGTATFDLQLVASQTYDFVFWADCSANQDDKHYNTDDLQNITVKDGYAGNNDEFDAFFASEQHTIDGAFAKQVILKRPFGQLSVTTKDISAILDEALKPTDVQVAFTSVPTSFNALTKEAGDYAGVTYTAPVVNDAGELSVDYIWAAPEKSDLADFSMTFLNNGTEITTNNAFKNIPICRNYRTNVTGNLLTKKGTINITINPEFEKPDITVVASTDELIGALNDPNVTNISITSDIDLSTQNAEELTFSTYKAIEIKEDKTLQLGNSNFLTAENGLTLTGGGTLDNSAAASTAVAAAAFDVHEHKSLIHVTGGDLLIDGVTLINDPQHHWHGSSYNSAAIAYWNDANVTIRNARIISGEFTICGMGREGANTGKVTLIDSYFESTSSNKDNGQHWAYAMRLFGSEVLIENCEVKGIQGGVSIEENAKAEIRSGKFYTVNTPGQKDAFYPLYVSSECEVTITGGEFIGANSWSNLAEGTSAVVSGDNDAGRPSGSVVLKGGKFSGKVYNHVTNTVYVPAEGYKWQAIEDDPSGLKWAVIAE